MWPENVPEKWHAPRKPFKIQLVSVASALQLAEDPTAFAFNSDISYQRPDGEARELLRMPGMDEGSGRFLGMSGQAVKSSARGSSSEYSVWRKSQPGYEAAWENKEVFQRTQPQKQLVVQVSENLAETGYEPGPFAEEDLKSLASGWEVQVLLDIDKTGAPVHVLIEKGSGNEDIDALVCRKVLAGKQGSKELRGGRIKVSYGFE